MNYILLGFFCTMIGAFLGFCLCTLIVTGGDDDNGDD